MTKYECLSCGGKYSDYQDGNSYFHRCPTKTKEPRNENVKTEWLTKEAPKGTDKIIAEGKGRVKV